MPFEGYLGEALDFALSVERHRKSNSLANINRKCRAGVLENWNVLSSREFLVEYLWCIGSSRKDNDVHLRYWTGQLGLFRQCDAESIRREMRQVVDEWQSNKCYLSPDMFVSVLVTANEIAMKGWTSFKSKNLLLPHAPESEDPQDWSVARDALRSLPGIGPVISWYLLRHLYGAPFFKPDQHIATIARHFFKGCRNPMRAMSDSVRMLWPKLCEDGRLLPVHLGEVDYILWFYRSETGLPADHGAR